MENAAEVVRLALGDIEFDPDSLKAKYLAERDKRLRSDGNEQYVEVKGDFSNYVDDPYEATVEREPLFDTVEIVIIGGGFGGLLENGNHGVAPGRFRQVAQQRHRRWIGEEPPLLLRHGQEHGEVSTAPRRKVAAQSHLPRARVVSGPM